jgi:hypothetical protein
MDKFTLSPSRTDMYLRFVTNFCCLDVDEELQSSGQVVEPTPCPLRVDVCHGFPYIVYGLSHHGLGYSSHVQLLPKRRLHIVALEG